MSIFVLLAVVTAILGVLPLVFSRKPVATGVTGGIIGLVSLGLYYVTVPSLAWPFYGAVGVMVVLGWIASAIVAGLDYPDGYLDFNFNMRNSRVAMGVAVIGVIAFLGRGCASSAMFHSFEYAHMIGPVTERAWTQDVQPKDPKHVRLVPRELAVFLADKQLGTVQGAIGSQFSVSHALITLQFVKGDYWYVAPLDYKGFFVWLNTDSAPGYVMVHGEDPFRTVKVVTTEKFVYTPEAFFGKNLERHIWESGYYNYALTDYSLEVDESGKAWWVVSAYQPTIGWSGDKVRGVIIVDPTSGDCTFHAMGSVPSWVDRAVPDQLVKSYLTWRGKYSGGFWNSIFGKKNLTKPEDPTIVYGSNQEPLWVACITSNNISDESMIGLVYVDSRTGSAVEYHAAGNTESAVLKAVNNKISFKKWHGADPVLYNVYGTMASIVPLLGESGTFQGVAIANVRDSQVAIGDDAVGAFREYQRILAQAGNQMAPETANMREHLTGVVDRFASELKGTATIYFVHVKDFPHLFTGGSELSSKLPVTQVGDRVVIQYIGSGEDVLPMLGFDNASIALATTSAQNEVSQRSDKGN
jgi:hypothetical protein